MKKIFLSLFVILLAMSVVGCTSSPSPDVPESSSSAPSEETSSTQRVSSMPENALPTHIDLVWVDEIRKTVNLSHKRSFPEPDEIVYYHDGTQAVFSQGTEEFEKVFAFNQARCPDEMNELQSGIGDWEPVLHQRKALEYRYESLYYSLYFNLETRMEGDTLYWVSTQNGWGMPLYGYAGEPTELLEYLDSVTE